MKTLSRFGQVLAVVMMVTQLLYSPLYAQSSDTPAAGAGDNASQSSGQASDQASGQASQQAPQQGEQQGEQQSPEQVSETEPLPDIDSQPIQPGAGGPGRFVPSEQISQDLGVSFPVDI